MSAYKSTITNSAFPQYLELNPEAPVRYRISFEGDPKLVVNIPTGPEYSAEVFELGGFTFRWAVEVTFDLDTHEIIGVSANSVWFDQEPESETLESSVE